MDNLNFIGRDWEINEIKKIVQESRLEGKLILIKAPSGMGKSVLLQMIKNEFDRDVENLTLCFYENLLSVDTPNIFFEQFLSNIESKIHPTKSQLKEFFTKYHVLVETIIQPVLGITGAVTGIPNLSDMMPLLPGGQQEKSQVLLQNEFVKMLTDFTSKFTDHRLLIMIDNIDCNRNLDAFVAALEDIADSLPNNVTLIVASIQDLFDVGDLISLTNFDELDIRKFVEMNLGVTKEDVINQIIEKSSGYPLTLDWLWQNHRKGENLAHLLLRLPKEGFLDLLQQNYLKLLDDNEVHILKVCAALDVIESRTISKISQIEEQRVKEVFDDFESSVILYLINYEELTNKQILDLYVLNDTFQKLIDSNYGQDIQIHKMALDHYVNSLIENLHYGRSRLIGIILKQYEHIAKLTNINATGDDFFTHIKLDKIQKFNLCNEIIQYYRFANDTKKICEWSQVQINIAQSIDDYNQRILYTKLASVNKYSSEENSAAVKQTFEELANWLESIVLPQTEDSKKSELISYIGSMRSLGSLITSDNPAIEDILNAMFGTENAKNLLPLFQNNLFQGIMGLRVAEEVLGAHNFEGSIELTTAALDLLKSSSLSDAEELSKIHDISFTPTMVDQITMLGNVNLGLSHLFLGAKMLETKDYDKTKVIENISKAVRLLEPIKSDVARGHFYFQAQTILEDLKGNTV